MPSSSFPGQFLRQFLRLFSSLFPGQFPRRSRGPAAPLRRRILAVAALLCAVNIAAWAWAFLAFRAAPLLLGTGLVAWGFGLRHAVDADHIAAIDNVTRRLMQDGRRPVSTGLWFALGHSLVVLIVTLAAAGAARALEGRLSAWREIGGLVSTLVSAGFLFLVAAMNIVILRGLWRGFARLQRGLPPEEDADHPGGGVMARLLRPLFALVSRPALMLPLGFLFGLGFDTATEISLLGLSATQAQAGLALGSVLVFPVLFAAGMMLVDTADGILMLGAYEWAFLRPVRRLYYNLCLTLLAVVVAVGIGGLETLSLIAGQFGLSGGIWGPVQRLSGDFGLLGFGIVALFGLAWGLSWGIYRLKGYDRLEPGPAETP